MRKRRRIIKRIINRAEIARQLGVTRQYVGMLLNGKRRSSARLQQIQKLIEAALREAVKDL